MLNDLENYQSAQPHVVSIKAHDLEIFVRDDMPQPGSVIRVYRGDEAVMARVHQQLGDRRVLAHLLQTPPDWLEPQCAVEMTHQPAALDPPSGNVLDLRQASFVVASSTTHALYPSSLPLEQIATTMDPMSIGVEAIDVLAPLMHGGTNLVVDMGETSACFDALCTRAMESMPDTKLVVLEALNDHTNVHQVLPADSTYGWMYALRATLAWANKLRDMGQAVCLVVTLPGLGAQMPEFQYDAKPTQRLTHQTIINTIGEAMASTHSARCTTIARLPLGTYMKDMAILLDTISFGDVDAQITLDDAGAFLPDSAMSRGSFTKDDPRHVRRQEIERAFERRAQIGDRVQIFGEEDCSEEDLQLLALAKKYERIVW